MVLAALVVSRDPVMAMSWVWGSPFPWFHTEPESPEAQDSKGVQGSRPIAVRLEPPAWMGWVIEHEPPIASEMLRVHSMVLDGLAGAGSDLPKRLEACAELFGDPEAFLGDEAESLRRGGPLSAVLGSLGPHAWSNRMNRRIVIWFNRRAERVTWVHELTSQVRVRWGVEWTIWREQFHRLRIESGTRAEVAVSAEERAYALFLARESLVMYLETLGAYGEYEGLWEVLRLELERRPWDLGLARAAVALALHRGDRRAAEEILEESTRAWDSRVDSEASRDDRGLDPELGWILSDLVPWIQGVDRPMGIGNHWRKIHSTGMGHAWSRRPRLRLEIFRLQLELKDFAGAARSLDRVLGQGLGGYGVLAEHLPKILHDHGVQGDEALAMLRSCHRSAPDVHPLTLHLAQRLRARKQWEEATTLLSKLEVRGDLPANIRGALSDELEALRLDMARATGTGESGGTGAPLAKLWGDHRADPRDPVAALTLARALEDRRDFEGALAVGGGILVDLPASVAAGELVERALAALDRMEDLELALRARWRASEPGPVRDGLALRLASFAHHRGDPKEVEALLEPLKTRPPKQHPTRSVSRWYLAHGDPEGARRSLEAELWDWRQSRFQDEASSFRAAEERRARLAMLDLDSPWRLWNQEPRVRWDASRADRLEAKRWIIRALRLDPGLESFLAASREHYANLERPSEDDQLEVRCLGAIALGDSLEAFEAIELYADSLERPGYLTPPRVAAARSAGKHARALELLDEQASRYPGDPEHLLITSVGGISEPQALAGERLRLAMWLDLESRVAEGETRLLDRGGVGFDPTLLALLRLEVGEIESANAALARAVGRGGPWPHGFENTLSASLSYSPTEAAGEFELPSGILDWTRGHSVPGDARFYSRGTFTVEAGGLLLGRVCGRAGDPHETLEARLAKLSGESDDPKAWSQLEKRAREAGLGAVHLATLDALARCSSTRPEHRIAWFEARARLDPALAVGEILDWLEGSEPREERTPDSIEAARGTLIHCLGRLDPSSEFLPAALDRLAVLEPVGASVSTWLELDRQLDPEAKRPQDPRVERTLLELDPERRARGHRERTRERAVRAGDARAQVLERLERLDTWLGFEGWDPGFSALLEQSGLDGGLHQQAERSPRDLRTQLAMAYLEATRGDPRGARERLLGFEDEHADHAGLRGALWSLHRALGDAESLDALERDWMRRVRRGSAWSPGVSSVDPRSFDGASTDPLGESAIFLERLRQLEGRGGSWKGDPRWVPWRVADLETAGHVRPARPTSWTWEPYGWHPSVVRRYDQVLIEVAALVERGQSREAADQLRFLELTEPQGPPGIRAHGLVLASSDKAEEVGLGLRSLWLEYLRPLGDVIRDRGRDAEVRAPFVGGPRGCEIDALVRAALLSGTERELLGRLAGFSEDSEFAPHCGERRILDGWLRALVILGREGQALELIRDSRAAGLEALESWALDLRRMEILCLLRLERFEEALLRQHRLHREQLRRGHLPDPPRVTHLTDAPGRMRFDWGQRSTGAPGSHTTTVHTPAEVLHEGHRLAVILGELGRREEFEGLVEELLAEPSAGSRGRALEGLVVELVGWGLGELAVDVIRGEEARLEAPGDLDFDRSWARLLGSGASVECHGVVAEAARERYGAAWMSEGPREETVLELLVGLGLEPELAQRRLQRARALEPREARWVILEARRLEGLDRSEEAVAVLDAWVLLELAHGAMPPPEVDAWRGLLGHGLEPSKRSRAQLARAWVEGLGWRSSPVGWRRALAPRLRGALGF